MKTLVSKIFLVTISAISLVHANTRDNVSLTFDNTTICIPKEYVPGLSVFGQYLKENVKGLDDSGQSNIIRLPAKLIMAGVEGYSFSHINKYNVDLEHEISGIANGLSEITGKPNLFMPCENEYDLGYCYQRVVYKSIFYQYTLKTVESNNKEKVRQYLYSLFQQWESNCTTNG